jgi:hypothetical protein
MKHDRIPTNGKQSSSKLSVLLSIGIVLVLALFSFVVLRAVSNEEDRQDSLLPVSNVVDIPLMTITATGIPSTAVPSSTSNAVSEHPLYLAGTKEAAWTAVAESDNEASTRVALTHAPRDTPGPPPIYPTETPVMGIVNHCANTNSRAPQCYNFWRGVINGDIVTVRAGAEGYDDTPSQGILMISNATTHTHETYLTPQIAGPIEIVSEDNLQFTLAVVQSVWATATPGATFVFDLTTRQWISPTLIPSVSPLPTYIPSP